MLLAPKLLGPKPVVEPLERHCGATTAVWGGLRRRRGVSPFGDSLGACFGTSVQNVDRGFDCGGQGSGVRRARVLRARNALVGPSTARAARPCYRPDQPRTPTSASSPESEVEAPCLVEVRALSAQLCRRCRTTAASDRRPRHPQDALRSNPWRHTHTSTPEDDAIVLLSVLQEDVLCGLVVRRPGSQSEHRWFDPLSAIFCGKVSRLGLPETARPQQSHGWRCRPQPSTGQVAQHVGGGGRCRTWQLGAGPPQTGLVHTSLSSF